MISMVLQAKRTTLEDVSMTHILLEPLCFGLCAERPDRDVEVLPALRAAIESQRALLNDPRGFNESSRRFHEIVVELCGSNTMGLIIGALEATWVGHESSGWDDALSDLDRDGATDSDSPFAAGARQKTLDAHEQIVTAIADGQADRVIDLARLHLESSRTATHNSSAPSRIRANLVGVSTTSMGHLI